MAALDEYYAKPSVDILQELFTALNSVSLASCPRPNPIEQRVMHLGVSASSPRTTTRASPSSASTSRSSDDDYPLAAYTPSRWYFRAEISLYSSPAVPLALTLHTCPDDVGAANLSFLLRVFQLQGSMRIFNAVLTRKRVLFVGYDHAAGDVSQMVLSAVAMVAPPLCGVIRRAFPYVNLTDLSFLEVDGFIAGATNPMFQQHNTWWDLLCVLDLPNKRGVVQTAEEHRAEEAAQKGKQYTPLPRPLEDTVHESADAKFISFVLSGLEARLGEEWVKTQFYEYTHEILMQAWDVELLKELEGRDSPPLFPAPILTGAAGGSARLARGSAGMSTNGATGGAVGAASPPPVAPAGVMVDKRRKRAEANKFRAAAVRRSPEFRALPINPWAWHEHRKMKGSRGGMGQMTMAGNVSEGSRASGKMLLLQLRRLQHDKDLDGPEAEAIFSLLEKGLHDEEACCTQTKA
ncbi:mesA [Symbiodinium microadriaticum]|nr:mesA [Symbiodinium microadriaticum]